MGEGEALAICCCIINDSEASWLETVTLFPLTALGVRVLGAAGEFFIGKS